LQPWDPSAGLPQVSNLRLSWSRSLSTTVTNSNQKLFFSLKTNNDPRIGHMEWDLKGSKLWISCNCMTPARMYDTWLM
jgi:hypothetical protein